MTGSVHGVSHSFENVATDVIQCSGCQRKIVIDIPLCLSVLGRNQLIHRFEQTLCTVHSESCQYRHDAQEWLRQKIPMESAIPNCDPNLQQYHIMTQLWPPGTLELLDRPLIIITRMWKSFVDIIAQVAETMEDTTRIDWTIPLQLSQMLSSSHGECILPYLQRSNGIEINTTPDHRDRLLTCDDRLHRFALALVIFGWNFSKENSATMQCPICNSRFDPLFKIHPPSCEPAAKRPRMDRNMESCHRHYCPWVSGFPRYDTKAGKDTPSAIIWRHLFDRITLEIRQAEDTTERALGDTPANQASLSVKVRELLRSCVSNRRTSLSQTVDQSVGQTNRDSLVEETQHQPIPPLPVER